MLQDLFARRTPPDAATTTTATATSGPAVIANRYDVIQPIGGGGMGRVFVAYDRNLKRNVAIKVLAPQLAGQDSFAGQLLREARAAAQLHHPHIATVHDVVESDGSLCIVMELLRGETLAARLRRKPLDGPDALRCAQQIVSALQHAHAHGLAHCDLTPGNVFLTEDAGVKVVDFGLARLVTRGSGHTTDGIGASAALIERRPGTPGYMSPEQELGLVLDQRTDIYSFGVVLREMVDAAAGSSFAPIVARATAPDLSERYQNAEELEAALQAIPPEALTTTRWRWRPLLIAAALVVAVAVALIVPFRRSTVRVQDAAVVGVPLFTSGSADPSMAYLASGLSDMVAIELGASNAVVMARSATVVVSEPAARQLANELGAAALLLGRVDRTGSDLTVGLRVYMADLGSFGQDASFTRSSEDLSGIRRGLATTVRSQLGAAGFRLRQSAQRPPDDPERLLPKAMTSFEEYAQARWFLERADVEANVNHAMTLLDRLVTREPTFALAHAALGEATWRKWQATRDPTWSDAAQRHALEALRLSAEQPEVRYAVALVYQGTGRSREALAELEQVARARPLNDDVQRAMGRLYADSGRLEEGLRALNRAIELRPGYWGNHASLGIVAYRAGRYDLAIKAFQRFCELRPDSASAHQRLGTAYHAAGNVAAALQSYERALQISPNANAYSNVGTIHFDEGRYPEAIKAYTQAIDLEPRSPSLRRNLGDALRRHGQSQAAAAAYGRAIDLATESLRVNPKDASVLSLEAVSLARTGRIAEAHSASNVALALAPNDSDVLFEHGLILFLMDRPSDAIDAFRRAVAAGYSVKRLKADPDLRPLADQPAFRRLTADGAQQK